MYEAEMCRVLTQAIPVSCSLSILSESFSVGTLTKCDVRKPVGEEMKGSAKSETFDS